jgi:hypothetical protein
MPVVYQRATAKPPGNALESLQINYLGANSAIDTLRRDQSLIM